MNKKFIEEIDLLVQEAKDDESELTIELDDILHRISQGRHPDHLPTHYKEMLADALKTSAKIRLKMKVAYMRFHKINNPEVFVW